MKVAIIGAGISGLYLAYKLAEKGQDVSLFEKEKEPGNKVCSGLFSERILEFIPESKSLIENEINSATLYFPRKKITIKFSRRFLVMNHSELDKLVFGLAKSAGAKMNFNQKISFLPEGYDRIIGCDGVSSFIRKEAGILPPKFNLGIQGLVQRSGKSDYVEIWPQNQGGFIWEIPRRNDTEYGILAKPELAKKLFEKFLADKNIKLEKKEAKMIPYGFKLPNNKSITLCGDAAGLTKPWSGGGVVWGLTAADMLLKYFPDFIRYKKEAERFFTPKIVFSRLAKFFVYFLGFNIPWFLPKNNKMESDFLR